MGWFPFCSYSNIFNVLFKGGTNTGVMKHVGEAVREHEMTLGSEDKVNVIGIATWGIVDRKESLIASRVNSIGSPSGVSTNSEVGRRLY